MKISLAWLADYVTFLERDPQKIAEIITASVAEVDDVERQDALLGECCVGKILKLGRHPNADRLSVCTIKTDKGNKEVVCGGTNLREGMRIAFAHVGANVHSPDGPLVLKQIDIRGVTSNGMICAADELELGSRFPAKPEEGARPIIDLGDGSDGVCKPLSEYLGLTDTILHIDNHAITQRADLFSHIGFARECVALGIATWKKKPTFPAPKFGKDKLPFTMKLEAKQLMPRYLACLIEVDGLGLTPDWMLRRLNAVGWRSLSTPVDITNFVASEIGVPLHSFDADDIKGTVYMRKARKDETMVTLDKKTRTLPEGALILSDDEGIFDLLGIMGGLRSSTKPGTRRIFVHSASLDPVSIRRGIIGTGLRTDAATVYEKGVPHITTEQGFNRAVQLMLELLPGARVVSKLESVGENGKPKPIAFSVERTQSLLGAEISEKRMKKILTDLECTVGGSGKKLMVTPPLHRLGDLKGSHDLTEEIARIYGYNVIENALPSASITLPARDTRVHRMRDALADQEYVELLPLSLVGPDLLGKCGIDAQHCTALENAIGHETSLMTPSTLPALLEHAEKNMLHVENTLRTFHISTVFSGGADSHRELGALLSTRSETDLKHDPFLRLKQEVQVALRASGYASEVALCREAPIFASANRCADVLIEGTPVGMLFEVHPDVCKQFDLPARAACVLINLSAVLAIKPLETVFATVPEFPAVSYDTTITMNHDKSAEELLRKIRASSALLESAEIVDLYGKESGEYKLTLRCVYRSPDKTLTEEEAKQEFAKAESLLS